MTEFKKNVLWAMLFLAVICISAAVIFTHRHFAVGGKTAKIIQDGSVVQTIDLEHVVSPYEFTVINSQGGKNTIRAEKGRIAVTEASCPDKICVNCGFIDSGVFPITCLPNRLSVVITDTAADGGIDAVVGGDGR